jgi:magnesium transporter
VVNCAIYRDGRRQSNIGLNEVSDSLKQKDQFIWIGLHEPSFELLSQVQKEFSLHELAIEDALTAHQRPKLELYGDTMFIVLRTAQMNREKHRIDFGESHFFLGHNFLVSVRHGPSVPYTEVRSRCEHRPKLLSKGGAFALYALMDFVVDHYFPVLEELEEELEELEGKIFNEKPDRQVTEDIYHLKRDLLSVKRAILPLTDICNRLMRLDFEVIPEDTRPYFRDVYDHTQRINEMVDNARELLTTALDANFSLISIAQNDVSKKFAGWAAILALPTMVAGIYGMNFDHMPEIHMPWAYPLVLFITFSACLLMYYFFRRSNWL